MTKARRMSWPSLKWPEKSSPAKTKTFLIHSFGRPVLIAARSGLRRGTTGSSRFGSSAGGGTVGCSEVIVSIAGAAGSSAGGVPAARSGSRKGSAGRERRQGSRRTPGLRMPAGSSSALAARRAAAKGAGRWRSYQGRWSRPTAWWWVIVPPPSISASETAALISSHCSTSPPRIAGREHGEVRGDAVGIGVGEAAGDDRRAPPLARRPRDLGDDPPRRLHHRPRGTPPAGPR